MKMQGSSREITRLSRTRLRLAVQHFQDFIPVANGVFITLNVRVGSRNGVMFDDREYWTFRVGCHQSSASRQACNKDRSYRELVHFAPGAIA